MNDERDKHLDQLSAYLDGELSAAESARIAEVLNSDAELAAELESLRATRELVGSLRREDAPDDFVDRVLSMAERNSLIGSHPDQAPPRSARWPRYLARAAVALIVISAGLAAVWMPSSPDEHGDLAGREEKINGIEVAAAPKGPVTKDQPDRDVAKRLKAKGRSSVEALTDLKTKDAPVPSAAPAAGPDVETRHFGKSMAKDLSRKSGMGKFGQRGRGRLQPVEMVVYTNDIPATRRDMERVLVSNSIRLVSAERAIESLPLRLANNTFQVARAAPSQVQLVAYMPHRQMPVVQGQLAEVQRRQVVLQGPTSPPEVALAKARAGRPLFDEEAGITSNADEDERSRIYDGLGDDTRDGYENVRDSDAAEAKSLAKTGPERGDVKAGEPVAKSKKPERSNELAVASRLEKRATTLGKADPEAGDRNGALDRETFMLKAGDGGVKETQATAMEGRRAELKLPAPSSPALQAQSAPATQTGIEELRATRAPKSVSGWSRQIPQPKRPEPTSQAIQRVAPQGGLTTQTAPQDDDENVQMLRITLNYRARRPESVPVTPAPATQSGR